MGFAAGFSAGSSAVNAYNARQRQEKLDAQDAELHTERMAEIAQAKTDKQAMRDAGAERTTMAGTAVTDGAGNKNLYTNPMQAAAASEDAKIEAEMRGQQPSMVTMQAATGITGNMAKGHQITTEPVDLKAVNGAEAKAGRFQAALEAQGKPLEAMNMSNAVMENKAKSLGLETAQLKFADDKFNRDVMAKLDADSDWTKSAAQLLTETQLGGLSGVNVSPLVSADGKTVSFVGKGADGTGQTMATFPNTPQGRLEFTQRLLKASPEMKISWMAEQGKVAREERKDNADIDLKKSHSSYYTSMAEVAGRKVDVTAGNLSDIDKLELGAIGKQKDRINEAMIKAQAEGSYDPSNPATAQLTTQLAALTLKERQITQRYSSAAAPDPLGVRKPTTSEAQMKVQATGDMGADAKAIQREIDKATADLSKVKDEPSRIALQAYLDDLKRQQGAAPPQAESTQPPAAKPPATPPKKPPAKPPVTPMQDAAKVATYTKWIGAKNAKNDLLSKASKMSPESAATYVAARLPDIELAIKANENYTQQ